MDWVLQRQDNAAERDEFVQFGEDVFFVHTHSSILSMPHPNIAQRVTGEGPFDERVIYRSSGRSPVSFEIFASAAGPISSLSWKQKVKLAQPGRASFR